MALHRKPRDEVPPAAADDYSERLHNAQPMARDDDGRPSGEDLTTYHSPVSSFLEPVPLPRWMRRRRKGTP